MQPICTLFLSLFLMTSLISTYSFRFSQAGIFHLNRFLSASSNGGADTVVSRCTAKITAALNPAKCIVTSTNDDPNGSHIQVIVVSSAFEGKRLMERQRLVYKAIWDEMSGPVHAVDSISAKTPSEAQ